MITKRTYIVFVCHDSQIVQKNQSLWEMGSTTSRSLFWGSYELALEFAHEEIFRQSRGPGTYAMIFECTTIVESPPVMKCITKIWDEKDQLRAVEE